MNGSLIEIIFGFYRDFFLPSNMNWLSFQNCMKYFYNAIIAEDGFFKNFIITADPNYAGYNFLSFITLVLTFITIFILLMLLFRLFKWMFNLIFKLFRLN